jgi:3-hydroxyacyl-CoA dehydrogenase
MKYADEIGLEKVLSVMEKYHDALGDYGKAWFKPAPLLQKLVSEGRRFN